jgi:uncharacterized protein
MHFADVRTGMEEIDRGECLRLLAMQSPAVGRLAVIIDGEPEIFPVNFGMVEDRVVFRTGAGTKLRGALGATRVTFEIDAADDGAHGWSVVVHGRCHAVGPDIDVLIRNGLILGHFEAGADMTWVMIEPDLITGRRIPAVRGWYW